MNYVGYDLFLTEEGIGLDEELTTEKLGWREGDCFQLVVENDRLRIKRIDPLVKFIKGID